MKVNVKSTSVCMDSEKVGVKEHWTGEISVAFGDQAFFFSPKNAVTLWRILVGEKDFDKIPYKRHGIIETSKEVFVWYDGDTEEWTLRFADDYFVVLDADEALALAWSLKKCVADALLAGDDDKVAYYYSCKTTPLQHVFVLSSKIVLTGDCAVEQESERLGGGERVFLEESSARDAARDYIRELVNESYSESYWDNADRNVDDVIDEIMSAGREGCWTHDGQTGSFEVKICRRDLEA